MPFLLSLIIGRGIIVQTAVVAVLSEDLLWCQISGISNTLNNIDSFVYKWADFGLVRGAELNRIK